MNTNRNGKIARLPRALRDELNKRIDDNHTGPDLIKWLNELPEVRTILEQHFQGSVITPQNLSEWRKGGFLDWFKFQHVLAMTRELLSDAGAVRAELNSQKVSEALATMMAIDFSTTIKAKLEATTDTDQRLECHYKLQSHIARLRRDDCRVDNQSLRRERWANQLELQKLKLEAGKQAAEAADKAETRRQMLAHFELQPDLEKMANAYGGTDRDWDKSAFILELKHKLKIGTFGRTGANYSNPETEFDAKAFPDDQPTTPDPVGRDVPIAPPRVDTQETSETAPLSRHSLDVGGSATCDGGSPKSERRDPRPGICQNPNKNAKIQVHPTASNLQKN